MVNLRVPPWSCEPPWSFHLETQSRQHPRGALGTIPIKWELFGQLQPTSKAVHRVSRPCRRRGHVLLDVAQQRSCRLGVPWEASRIRYGRLGALVDKVQFQFAATPLKLQYLLCGIR